MAHPQIAIFARLAKENSTPARVLAGQKTLLSRTMHDIRYDAIHDEIVAGNPFALSILTFRGDADGEQAPIRTIQGPRTQMLGPERLDVDPVHNEIFLPNERAILVFSREANGDVAPIRTIQGPDTRITGAYGVAVDPVHNLIIVGNRHGGYGENGMRVSADEDSALLIFNRTDNGNAKPVGIIAGPHTGVGAINQMAVIPSTGWIIVPTSAGLGTKPGDNMEPQGAMVGIWSEKDNGDVPAHWILAGPKSTLKKPRGVAFDTKHKEVIVADMRLNSVFTFYFPEIF